MTVIDLHILQAYPPSLLNHEESEQPKTVVFGGVTRTRLSSQSLRRAQRLNAQRQGLIPVVHLGRRTRHLPFLLAKHLTDQHGLSAGDGLTLALNTVWGMGLLDAADAEHRTRALLFLSIAEIEWIAAEIARRAAQLLCAAVPPSWIDAAGEPDNAAADTVRGYTAKCPRAFRTFGRDLLHELGTTSAVDVALYGRFLAAKRWTAVDGACSTAHAFSVGEHRLELDHRSVVADHGGAAPRMPSPASLTAPLLYSYSNLDICLLMRNLGGNLELAEIAASAWLTAALHAVPGVNKISGAPVARPLLAFSVARTDQALSLANAFLRPIQRTRAVGERQPAIAALIRHWAHMGDAFGHHGVRSCHFVYADEAAVLPAGMPGRQVNAAELAAMAAHSVDEVRSAV